MGKPLFMWSVEDSLKSIYIDKTVISSNCKEVKKLSKKYNSKIVFIQRPEEISGDLSKNEEALIHTLNILNEEYDAVVNLQPTSPIRGKLIDDCIEVYYKGNYKSLLTGTRKTPFFWQKRNGKWEYITGDDCCKRKMRQEFTENDMDSEFVMHDNGNIYITDVEILKKTKCRISDNHMVYETSGVRNLQIDNEFDFKLFEKMLEVMM